MTLVLALFILALFLSLAMTIAWRLAETTGNHGYVDTIWSFSTGFAGVVGALLPVGTPWLPRQLLVAGLVALWSLRLGSHIFVRTRSGKDDPRYAALRKQWGAAASRRLFVFLQIQALAGFILALAVTAAAHRPEAALGIGDIVGIGLALVAIAGAAIADRQLAAFRADPANRGKVCDAGLWGLTRHPNYFFEWLGWTAYALIGLDLGFGYPYGFAALLAPILMYWLLVHASGIPPTEAHMLASRGAAFRDYQRRVNAFWPGPARR